MIRLIRFFILLIPALLSFVARGNAQPVSSRVEKSAGAPYRISAGDQLTIRFTYHREMNTDAWVRPDGVIALDLIGDVKVAGLTTARLDSLLEAKYNCQLVDPKIAVIVKSSAGQKVFVGGEVQSPKIVELNGEMTVLGAVFAAGGFKNSAKLTEVIVVRKDQQGGARVIKMNVKNSLQGKNDGESLTLQPFDVVYVQKSGIARANLFTEHFIETLLPTRALTGFAYLYFAGQKIF